VPRTALHRPHWILVSDAVWAGSIGLIVRLPQSSQTILNSEFSNIIISLLKSTVARHVTNNKDEVLSSQLDDVSESSDLLKKYRTSTSPPRLAPSGNGASALAAQSAAN
jgi:hypothetical protein